MQVAPGTDVGPYRIERLLGAGGMGEVYLGRDRRLDRAVAIKLLPAERHGDADRKRTLLQEARSLSALQHPNIVTIYDIESLGDTECLVMEYVNGKTLDEVIPRSGLPVKQVLRYAIQIADGLAAAHTAGILHRDLKPANIIVSEEGTVKLLDFGLAQAGEGHRAAADLTATMTASNDSRIVGTTAYMSPEQVQGYKLDARSDIFAFGTVLYEMVTGRRAFEADSSLQTMAAVVGQEPTPTRELSPDVPTELERTIRRCLRKDPDRRWHTMRDVKVALEELREESESGQLLLPASSQSRRSRRVWALAAGALFAVAGALWFAYEWHSTLPLTMKITPVTSFPGIETHPSFSPDGTQIAFAWNGENRVNWDIYVQLVAGGAPVRLTTDAADERMPRWSPDGRHIAFLTREGTAGSFAQITLISPLGGRIRRGIARTVEGNFEWLPDAQTVVTPDGENPREPLPLVLISISSGEKKRLSSPPAGTFGDIRPAVSPRGDRIAFLRCIGVRSCDIFVIGTQGGEPRRVADLKTSISGVTWTSDGRHLVFSADRGDGYKLWRIRSDTSTSIAEEVHVPGPALWATIRRTPAGTMQLAYGQLADDSNIWVYDAASNQLKETIASSRRDWLAHVSPDGSRIAFTSDRSGASECWTANIDGSDAFQVTRLRKDLRAPTWSADGTRLAMESMEKRREIYIVNADGTGLRQITRGGLDYLRPTWSPDGNWIFFIARPMPSNVQKIPADGGAAVVVWAEQAMEPTPSFDGKWLYTSSAGGIGVQRTPMGGGRAEVLLPDVPFGAWALTDNGIYHVEIGQGTRNHRLMFFDVSTRISRPVLTFDGEWITSAVNLSASRDGRYVAWALRERFEGDIMLVEDFR